MRGPPAATQLGDDYRPPSRGPLPPQRNAQLYSHVFGGCVVCVRRYQIDLHCAGLPLERNIHSLPQPAGPVKVANGGHLSGTKKQVAGYDKNSWLRLANYGNRWHSGCVLQRDTGVPGSS